MKRRTLLSTLGSAALFIRFPTSLSAETVVSAKNMRKAAQMLAQARQSAGMPAVTSSNVLMSLESRQTAFMRDFDQTTHHDSMGLAPDHRAAQIGYSGQILGEALAETFGPADEVMRTWLDIPVTRKILLDPKARSFGLAATQGADRRIWWALVMGTL